MPSAQPKWQAKGVEAKARRPASGGAGEVFALLLSLLSSTWRGNKGETYELSASASGKSWTCYRVSPDGSSKKFTLKLDESTGLVWWGNWTYYFNPSALSFDSCSISWFQATTHKAFFTWTCEAPRKDEPVPAQVPETVPQTVLWLGPEPEESEDEQEKQLKAFFLPDLGLKDLPAGFRPPPGLDAPEGLQLYEEMPSRPEVRREKSSALRSEDGETSAGSSVRGDSETDTDLSESEGSRKTAGKQEAKPAVVQPWRKEAKAAVVHPWRKAKAEADVQMATVGRWRKASFSA
eukprot:gb/GFBE01009363.1/.p1 GENE.gb/GFBE01009363.1/~~gb/GFBE01009363.1/.p1  ORF type:complete len:292 (+),score=66.55 gb/GFBE01009363.1/:1-876(+)